MSYTYATWLADALRAGGLKVVEHDGWKTRGRPASVGNFDPKAIVVHHDASAVGPTPSEANYIANVGRPPGTPAPLSQLWVDYDGVWHVLAAGRANHAGEGAGWGVIPANSGNTYALGIETDHTTGEKLPQGQYDSIVKGVAVLARYMKIDVRKAVCGHKEYAPGRKTDPDWDMNQFRKDVAAEAVAIELASHPVTPNTPNNPVPGARPAVSLKAVLAAARYDAKAKGTPTEHKVDVLPVERALVAEKLLDAKYADGSFGTLTITSYAAWQHKLGYKGADANGIPGAASLAKLGAKHGFTVKP